MIELHDHVKNAFFRLFRLYLEEKAIGKNPMLMTNLAGVQKPNINHIYTCIRLIYIIIETDQCSNLSSDPIIRTFIVFN